MRLSAQGSGISERLVGYRWEQVDGPVLQILTPTAIQTEVRLGGDAPAQAYATLRLTLTHVDGATESADVRLTVTGGVSTTADQFFRLSAAAGGLLTDAVDVIGGEIGGSLGGTAYPLGDTLVFRHFVLDSAQASDWSFALSLKAGETVVPGRYEGLVDPASAVSQNPPDGRPHFEFEGLGVTCIGSVATVSLHEIEFNEEFRSVTRMAADIDVTCQPGRPPVRLLVRYYSDYPLPP